MNLEMAILFFSIHFRLSPLEDVPDTPSNLYEVLEEDESSDSI